MAHKIEPMSKKNEKVQPIKQKKVPHGATQQQQQKKLSAADRRNPAQALNESTCEHTNKIKRIINSESTLLDALYEWHIKF